MTIIGALIVGFVLGAWIGVTAGIYQRDAIRKQAIEHGFATWVSDENGNTTFTWKEPTP